jgi:glutathione S-transferase
VEALAGRSLAPERAFADLAAWEGAPLFPVARGFFLSAESAAGRCVRLIEAFRVVLEKELPDEVEGRGLLEDEVRLLARCCTARGVLFQGGVKSRAPRAGEGLRGPGRPRLAEKVRGLRAVLPGARPRIASASVLFVRPEEPGERAEALERLRLVAAEEMGLSVEAVGGGFGPAPELMLDDAGRRATREAEAAFDRLSRELRDAPSVAAAFVHDEVSFADLAAGPDLDALLLDRLPRAVRRAEGVRSVLRRTGPRALCALHDDALALAAARAERVPSVPFADPRGGPEVLRALEAASRGEGMVG